MAFLDHFRITYRLEKQTLYTIGTHLNVYTIIHLHYFFIRSYQQLFLPFVRL